MLHWIHRTTYQCSSRRALCKDLCFVAGHSSHGYSTKIDREVFSVLCSGGSIFDLKVKEAYLIKTLKPELNVKYESIKQSDSERYQKQSSDS